MNTSASPYRYQHSTSSAFSFFRFLAVFFFAHPATEIGVDWWITAPSCAVNAVGIESFCPQRL